MDTVHQGATFQLAVRYLQEDGITPVDLAGVNAELRMSGGAFTGTYSATIDTVTGEITADVDRTVTATWPTGTFKAQLWLDYGEGQSPESAVILDTTFTVLEGL